MILLQRPIVYFRAVGTRRLVIVTSPLIEILFVQSNHISQIKSVCYFIHIMNRLALLSETISSTPPSFDKLQTLRVVVEGQVATIWFNKHSTFNSISQRMAAQFRQVLPAIDNIPSVKVILIRSKHPKIFCAGADLKDLFLNQQREVHPSLFSYLEKAFRDTNKPLISVVQGAAMGGGFQIALLTDLIVCSDKATFVLPQIKLGIMPGLGGTQHLTRLVGTKLAMEKILLAEPIKGKQAQALNIAICYPSEVFDQKLSELLEKILNKASRALQAAKKAVHASTETTLEQGLLYEAAIFQNLFGKESAKEGLSAFVEKRKPNFRNL